MNRLAGIIMLVAAVIYGAMYSLVYGYVTLDHVRELYALTNIFLFVSFGVYWILVALILIYRNAYRNTKKGSASRSSSDLGTDKEL